MSKTCIVQYIKENIQYKGQFFSVKVHVNYVFFIVIKLNCAPWFKFKLTKIVQERNHVSVSLGFYRLTAFSLRLCTSLSPILQHHHVPMKPILILNPRKAVAGPKQVPMEAIPMIQSIKSSSILRILRRKAVAASHHPVVMDVCITRLNDVIFRNPFDSYLNHIINE